MSNDSRWPMPWPEYNSTQYSFFATQGYSSALLTPGRQRPVAAAAANVRSVAAIWPASVSSQRPAIVSPPIRPDPALKWVITPVVGHLLSVRRRPPR